MAQNFFYSRGNGGIQRRHNRGENSSLDIVCMNAMNFQNIFNIYGIFCACFIVIGGQALDKVGFF